MPDIFSSAESEVERLRIQKKHVLAERVTEEGHLVDKDGNVVHAPKTRDVSDYSHVMRDFSPSINPFAAFMAKPKKLRFTTQAQGETVILLLRQHPVTQVGWMLMATAGVFLPALLSIIHFLDFLPGPYQTAVMIGWYLVLLGFIVESFLKWFYNVYIITDERVIDVDFSSLLYRDISSAKIDRIEDVTAQTAGFLSALFDFGTVVIQTAAERREFEFNGIPHPAKVTTLLNDLILEEEREKLEGRVI